MMVKYNKSGYGAAIFNDGVRNGQDIRISQEVCLEHKLYMRRATVIICIKHAALYTYLDSVLTILYNCLRLAKSNRPNWRVGEYNRWDISTKGSHHWWLRISSRLGLL